MGFLSAILTGDDPDRRETVINCFLAAYLVAIVAALMISMIDSTVRQPSPIGPTTPELHLLGGDRTGGSTVGLDATTGASEAETERPELSLKNDPDKTPEVLDPNLPDELKKEPDQAAAKRPNRLGILDSNFSLSDLSPRDISERIDNEGRIQTKKDLLVGNTVIGSLPITIDGNSSLFIESRDLKALLTNQETMESRLEKLPQSGLLSFKRLRDLGIDLRYSPTLDKVTLQRP